MDEAYRYESLICDAFGSWSGSAIGRHGDPGGLADSDKFTSDNIASVKAAVVYSMEILFKVAANRISDNENISTSDYTNSIICAESLTDIDKIITDYNQTIIKKYFKKNEYGVLI